MTTAQVVETSVTVNNSPFQDYVRRQSYKQIPRQRRTLVCRCSLVHVGRTIFVMNLQQNRKNARDDIPEMFVNCQQSSY